MGGGGKERGEGRRGREEAGSNICWSELHSCVHAVLANDKGAQITQTHSSRHLACKHQLTSSSPLYTYRCPFLVARHSPSVPSVLCGQVIT